MDSGLSQVSGWFWKSALEFPAEDNLCFCLVLDENTVGFTLFLIFSLELVSLWIYIFALGASYEVAGPSVVQSDGVVLVLDGTAPRSSGRQKTRTSVVRRASTAVRLPPLAGHFGATLFLFDFLFLFLFPTLTYLSTSICLTNQFCASVIDGRRRPSTQSRTALRQSVPSKDETVSSFVVLTPSWTDGTTGISVKLTCI